MSKWLISGYMFAAFLLLSPPMLSGASHPDLVTHDLSYTHDVGFGNSLYVVGDAGELGAGDPANGVKMRFTSGNVWRVQVAVRSDGAGHNYRYVSRSTAATAICDPANGVDVATDLQLPVVTSKEAPYSGKRLTYLSSWNRAFIRYRSSESGVFTDRELKQVGEGRTIGEFRYSIDDIGVAGESLEFVFFNGEGDWDNAFGQAGVNYRSPLDFLHIQDGHVFNYEPAASVSSSRIETRTVQSTASGIPARTVRIYLPRGYDEHTQRQYPVVYLHDGQNVFSPGGAFGSWDADLTANAEIQMGRMRESILVAIDNTADRLSEYLPPTDEFNGTGRGDAYADFVVDNVRPTLDFNYRTLSDPLNTLLIGSSFGGIITAYMGWEHSDVFGKIGVFSPASWAIPNLRSAMRDAPQRSERIYLYWGTAESSVSADEAAWWAPFLDQYDIYLSQGHVIGANLLAEIGCGAVHNESAWAAHLPAAYRFLLDIRDEANILAYTEDKPALRIGLSENGRQALVDLTLLNGYSYAFEQKMTLGSVTGWNELSTVSTGAYWESVQLEREIQGGSGSEYFRVVARP